MDTQTPPKTAEIPKTISFRRHQRQRFWQIIFPVVFGVLLILVILVLVILRAAGTPPGGQVSQWADTALIWLSLPALMSGLLLVVILIGIVLLVGRLLMVLPNYTFMIQQYVDLVPVYVTAFADKLVKPIIAMRSVKARVSALSDLLFGRRND